jgi:hypothetical protein
MLLSEPSNVSFVITDAGHIEAANRSFPYNTIAVREK